MVNRAKWLEPPEPGEPSPFERAFAAAAHMQAELLKEQAAYRAFLQARNAQDKDGGFSPDHARMILEWFLRLLLVGYEVDLDTEKSQALIKAALETIQEIPLTYTDIEGMLDVLTNDVHQAVTNGAFIVNKIDWRNSSDYIRMDESEGEEG